MKLSVIIPAYNEESELPCCLQQVRSAFSSLEAGDPELDWELIVTDNNSTDATGEIARRHGAIVVFEAKNQIARARNVGANQATGDWFLFLDADSRLHVESARDLLQAIDSGHCGAGGCLIRMDDAPFWGRCGVRAWNTLSRNLKWAAGSFVFCRADAFHEIGGFDEQYFAAEELYFSSAVKKWCAANQLSFQVLQKQPHASSSRKFRIYSTLEILTLLRRVLFSYGRTVRSQAALDFFYDGRR